MPDFMLKNAFVLIYMPKKYVGNKKDAAPVPSDNCGCQVIH